jgi:hypothetical protein
MAETNYFPRRLILGGAMITGVLLALAVHMLGARYGLDLGGLWRGDTRDFVPAGAAIAWWLIATAGFSGGYFTATLMDSAVSGQIPQRMRQFLIAIGVLVLAGAGQAASAPSPLGRQVDLDVLVADRDGSCLVGTSQQRPDPGQKFFERKGLGQIVVGTCVEAVDALGNGIASRQEQNGRGAIVLSKPS